MTPGACPEPFTLDAFVEGTLEGAELAGVDAHLDSCPDCRAVVSTLSSGERVQAARGLETIGRFVLEEELGRGAMGVVYAGRDPTLDRRVAVKLLAVPEGSEARATARLQREARAMAKLSHPNVVGVYEVGVHTTPAGDALVFVAMELVDGQSLREWMRTGPAPQEILRVFLEAGEGLAAAHAAGIVHRDFKPDNVMLDASGHAKVGDFGLASRERDWRGSPDVALEVDGSLTRTGALMGTPAYMAPERLRGEGGDESSDQFAFCVSLYECLEGRRPFEGGSVSALEDAMKRPPSMHETPRFLRTPLLRGLAAEASERHPSLPALLARLRRPSRAPAIAAAVILAVGVGALAMYGSADTNACAHAGEGNGWDASTFEATLAAREGPSTASAIAGSLADWLASWRAARVDACEATHVRHVQSNDALDLRVACLDRAEARFERIAEAIEDAPVRQLEPLLDALPELEACDLDALPAASDPAASASGGSEALESARVALAAGQVEEAEALVRGVLAQEGPAHREAWLLLADIQETLGDDAAATASVLEGLLEAQRAGDERTTAQAWVRTLTLEGARGDYLEAAASAQHAEAWLTRIGSPRELEGRFRNALGAVRYGLGDLAGARSMLEAALPLRDGGARVGVLTNLGNVERAAGEYPEALAHHREALAADAARLGDTHPKLAVHHHNIGGVLRAAGELLDARVEYQRALALSEPDTVQRGLTENSLGLVRAELGDSAGARDAYQEALRILRGRDHAAAALSLYNLAALSADAGDWEAALRGFDEALALDIARSGAQSPRAGKDLLGRADALMALGRGDEAAIAYARAREIGQSEEARAVGLADEILQRADAGLAATRMPTRPRTSRRVEPLPAEVPVLEPPTRPLGSGGYGAGQSFD